MLGFFNGTPVPWLRSIRYLLTDAIPAETRNIKKQDKRLFDGTLPPLVLLLVLCNCRDSRPQDRTAATTQTLTLAVLPYPAGTSSHSCSVVHTLAVLLYSAGTSSHSNTCGAHAV